MVDQPVEIDYGAGVAAAATEDHANAGFLYAGWLTGGAPGTIHDARWPWGCSHLYLQAQLTHNLHGCG